MVIRLFIDTKLDVVLRRQPTTGGRTQYYGNQEKTLNVAPKEVHCTKDKEKYHHISRLTRNIVCKSTFQPEMTAKNAN